jgi:hypothetical protein
MKSTQNLGESLYDATLAIVRLILLGIVLKPCAAPGRFLGTAVAMSTRGYSYRIWVALSPWIPESSSG